MFRFRELFDIVQALVFICTHLILGSLALNSKSSKRKLLQLGFVPESMDIYIQICLRIKGVQLYVWIEILITPYPRNLCRDVVCNSIYTTFTFDQFLWAVRLNQLIWQIFNICK